MRGYKHTVSLGFSAINVNELQVTFNKAVDDTKAVFAVKRGTVTEDVTVTWNDAKTEANLKRAVGNFPAAEYTVTVTGLEFAEGKNTGTATVAAETIESVVIKNESLQISGTAPVSIGFINQYGKESTAVTGAQYTLTGYNITTGTTIPRVGTAAQLNTSAGAPTMVAGNDVRITVFHSASGKTATKEMKLVPAATVGKVDLGQVIMPTGKTRLTPAGTKMVEVTYTAENTLGETYKLVTANVGTTNEPVKVFSSKASVLDPAKVVVDGNNKIMIQEFAGAGTVTLTFLVQATGYTSTLDITVEENEGAAYEVTLAESTAQFAANSTNPIYVGLTVTDKYGTALTPAQVAAAATANQIVVFFDDTTTLSAAGIETSTAAGVNYGKLKITPLSVAKDKNANVTVRVVSSNKQASVQVTAAAASVPTTIDTKQGTTVATTMMAGGTQTIMFDVKDQYGTKQTGTDKSKYEVRYSTSNTAAVTLNNTTADHFNGAAGTGKVMTAVAAGTSVVKATLWDVVAGAAIAEKSYTITVTASGTTDTTYYIEDIPTLYAKLAVSDVSSDTMMDIARNYGYAKEVVVKATTPQGTVTVPTNKIVNVSTNHAGVVTRLMSSGKYFIATNDAETGLISAPATSGKVILTVVVNADDNVVTLTKDITVSNEAPVAQTVAWKDKYPVVDNVATAKAVTALPDLAGAAKFTGDIAAAGAYFWVQDQYGGYYLSNEFNNNVAGLPQVVNTKPALTLAPAGAGFNVGTATAEITTGDKADAATNKGQDGKITVTTGTATFTADNAQFRVIGIKDGKTAFLTGKVLDNTTPKAATTGAITVTQAAAGTYAKDDTIKIKFSEKVKVADVALTSITVSDGKVLTTGADAAIAPATTGATYDDTFVITLGTGTDVVTGTTLTVDKTKVVDEAGNAAAADVVFTLP